MAYAAEPLPAVTYERTPGAASAPLPPGYRRREPETGVLYQIVQEHLETFLAEPHLHGADGYPRFVEHEFRRFLDCGLLSRGLVRIRCGSCGHEKLVAFSCKGRSICPSCVGRRMTDVAAQLRDLLMPEAPYRQWVLSFPYPLRFHLARNNTFFSAMLRGFLRTVFAWQRRRGRAAGIPVGQPAAVAMLQRFGSALQLTPHIHAALPDGLWIPGPGDVMGFAELAPPTDEDVAHLAYKVARRLTKVARRHLAERETEYYDPDDETAARDHCLGVAIRPPVRPSSTLPIGEPFGAGPKRKPLCASVSGFSLHAATRVAADDRDGLERLLRYGLRAPFSQKRLSVLPDGRVRYELRRPWPTPNGVTELIFEPLQLMKRLASLIPTPYTHLVRYYGFANRSKYRPRLPVTPEARALAAASQQARASAEESSPQLALPLTDAASVSDAVSASDAASDAASVSDAAAVSDAASGSDAASYADAEPELAHFPASRPRRSPWAVLLRRAFGVEALRCDCGAAMTVLAMITDVRSLERILTHLGLPAHPPPIAPARLEDQLGLGLDRLDDVCPDNDSPTAALASARGPP